MQSERSICHPLTVCVSARAAQKGKAVTTESIASPPTDLMRRRFQIMMEEVSE